jgi:uncharacterized DUF497 family protein
MNFEWDEAKRAATLAARQIDLLDMRQLFDGRAVLVYPSPQNDEERWTTAGKIEGRLFAVI